MTVLVKKRFIQIFSDGSLYFCFRNSLQKTYQIQLVDADFKKFQIYEDQSNNLELKKKKKGKYRKRFLMV